MKVKGPYILDSGIQFTVAVHTVGSLKMVIVGVFLFRVFYYSTIEKYNSKYILSLRGVAQLSITSKTKRDLHFLEFFFFPLLPSIPKVFRNIDFSLKLRFIRILAKCAFVKKDNKEM